MHYTSDGRFFDEPSPYDGLKVSMRQVYDECSSLVGIPNLIVTSPRVLATIEGIKRSTFSFWRDQQVEPDLQAILSKHYDRLESLDVSRRDTFDNHEFSWKTVESGAVVKSALDVAKIQALYNLTAASPHINRGALVAKAWEKYVGAMPERSLFDYEEKLAKEFIAPLEYTKAPEQPSIGLLAPVLTKMQIMGDLLG